MPDSYSKSNLQKSKKVKDKQTFKKKGRGYRDGQKHFAKKQFFVYKLKNIFTLF